jgi:hypothetical protein
MKTRHIRNKWLVLQYDDRNLEQDYKILMNRNKEYAKLHGYEYKFVKSGHKDIPPYWRKVELVKELLPKYKGILWIDTDAVVFDMNKSLNSITRLSYSFYKSQDNWKFPNHHFNAGVWLIKNTPEMNMLMADWSSLYKEKDWLQNSQHKWHTTGKWSNTTYEQGSFIDHIQPKYKKHIKRLPCNILQGCLEDINTKNEPFIIHFMSRFKEHIPGFVKTFILMPEKS